MGTSEQDVRSYRTLIVTLSHPLSVVLTSAPTNRRARSEQVDLPARNARTSSDRRLPHNDRLNGPDRCPAQVTNFVTQRRKLALDSGSPHFNGRRFCPVQHRFSPLLLRPTAPHVICNTLLVHELRTAYRWGNAVRQPRLVSRNELSGTKVAPNVRSVRRPWKQAGPWHKGSRRTKFGGREGRTERRRRL